MKYNLNTILTFFVILFLSTSAFAQDNSVEMADVMRSNGKIYVVVAVVSIILLALLIFLIRLDIKVKRLEESMRNRQS